jgi:hypothetical protein
MVRNLLNLSNQHKIFYAIHLNSPQFEHHEVYTNALKCYVLNINTKKKKALKF